MMGTDHLTKTSRTPGFVVGDDSAKKEDQS